MHLGGLTIIEGPPPPFQELLRHIRRRLHLVPRYRHKLAYTPLDRGRPVWIDDPSFNLEYHVRHTALPSPGTWEQLLRLTARIFSQSLDRSKPLWEMWLIEGLEEDRCALISKNHHALIDGISGIDLATVLFDLSPQPAPVPHPARPWHPRQEPSARSLLTVGARGALRAAGEVAAGLAYAVTHPERALEKLIEASEGVAEVASAGMNPAPPTPLNVRIGPHRRFVGVRCTLADFKLVKNAFGGTVNDVVLAVVTGALRSFLISRGIETEGLQLRGLVPVSVRARDEHHQLGNRITAMRAPLPVYISDPLERFTFMRHAMEGLKESRQALGASVLTEVQNFAPPTVLAQASRLNFSTRLFNLIVTNVPGPQVPLYVLGRKMLHAYPIAFLPRNHALAIAIMSYNGEMNFGLLGDFDALPDIDTIGRHIEQELASLLTLARDAQLAQEEAAETSAGTAPQPKSSQPKSS